MKIYTVWSGEYEDKFMAAVFLDEKKAEKYAQVQTELNPLDDYWVLDYETQDEKFDINTTVYKFYYATIPLFDRWNDDNTVCWEKAGEVETDELWDGFMEYLGIESYEDLDPNKYGPIIEKLGNTSISALEDDYVVTYENSTDSRTSYVNYNSGYNEEPYSIVAYSQLGYYHARKLALDEYYKWKSQQEEN